MVASIIAYSLSASLLNAWNTRSHTPLTAQRAYDHDLYQARHLIENFFCKLKQFRAIATRYDKTKRNFLAALHLAASAILLN